MEEMHRTHKDVAWGWIGAVIAGLRMERARRPAADVRRRRRGPARIQTPWGRHVAHYG